MRISIIVFSVLMSGCGGVIRGLSRTASEVLPDDFVSQLAAQLGIRLVASIPTDYWTYIFLALVLVVIVFINRRCRKRF